MVMVEDKRKLVSRLNRYTAEVKHRKSYNWVLWAVLILIVMIISNLG